MIHLRPGYIRNFSATVLGATALGVGLYTFGTHEQKLYQLDHATESLAQSAFSRSINPYSNETLSDIHIARIPLTQLPSELLKDYRRGGSRLVETYCAGLLGGWAFGIQRRLAQLKSPANSNSLLSRSDILSSRFEEGVSISNEFVVIEKSPTSIVFRGGSPSDNHGLRELDVLMEGFVEIDDQNKVAIFGFKCMIYSGTPEGAPPPLPKGLNPLHLIYARALAANGVQRCRQWAPNWL